jgi:phosphatidylserine synthase
MEYFDIIIIIIILLYVIVDGVRRKAFWFASLIRVIIAVSMLLGIKFLSIHHSSWTIFLCVFFAIAASRLIIGGSEIDKICEYIRKSIKNRHDRRNN